MPPPSRIISASADPSRVVTGDRRRLAHEEVSEINDGRPPSKKPDHTNSPDRATLNQYKDDGTPDHLRLFHDDRPDDLS